MSLPQRPRSHTLESISKRYFENCLPESWTCSPVQFDYGVDLMVNIIDGTNATPYELLVQIKASDEEIEGDTELVILKRTTFNLLKGFPQVVMLVKYVNSTRRAYYQLLVQAIDENPRTKLLRIKIPKTNRLEAINWSTIAGYVKEIVDFKIASAEPMREAARRRDFNTN